MKIDTTQPHVGRIYDYVLGGHHNYEADRKAAEQILKVAPAYPKWARLNRWFLQLVGQTWAEEARARVLDVASGLPTQGHFDEYLPQAKILFSDIDPVSVTYGQQILEARPNMKYAQADLRAPAALLAEAAGFFGAERQIAVGAIGILYLLPDAEVRRLMADLHAFCAPGSVLAFSFMHLPEGPNAAATLADVRKGAELARVTLYVRGAEEMAELIKPWRLRVHRNAEEWLDVREMLTERDLEMHVVGALADH